LITAVVDVEDAAADEVEAPPLLEIATRTDFGTGATAPTLPRGPALIAAFARDTAVGPIASTREMF
jgi:hypothetical protein